MSPDLASPRSPDQSHQAGLVTGLLSVGHAVPPHRMLQSDAAAAARRIFAHRYAAFERMAPVFETAGIRTRHTVKPIDWYLTELGWPERNAAYLEGAQALFIDAASRALANAGCEARDVDTIVTVSSTGIATPSLEARVGGPSWAFARCRARAGVRPGLRRRRVRPRHRQPPGARPAGFDRSHGRDRDLHRGLPHGPAFRRQHGGDRPVRRRRRGLCRAERRERPGAHRGRRRASMARQSRHHGLEGRPERARRHLRPLHSAVRRRACRIGGRRHPGAHRRGARIPSIASPAIPAAPR